MLSPPIVLNEASKAILYELEHGSDHLFVTGKAGTGKSTLLNTFRKTTKKNIVVLAPTGVAAINVKGQTIHSFFRIPPKLVQSEEITIMKGMGKIMKQLDIVIIDEISMVRADLFDHIDYVLRYYRKSTEAFGGVRMILFGDLYQLPPVVASDAEKFYFREVYPHPYFFAAKVFQQSFQLYLIELTQVYRQTDPLFVQLLDRIRRNDIEEDDLDILNKHIFSGSTGDGIITLCTTNAIADSINQQKLSALSTPMVSFQANLTGQFSSHIPPADPLLNLKEGAQIMFLRNDTEQQYANGTLGVIKSLTTEKIVVDTLDGLHKSIEVSKVAWDMIRYQAGTDGSIKEEIVGSFKQYPIKLAWAVTIHKSQGATFDRVVLDLGRGSFEFGQTYVALSRCRTLEGIQLKKPIKPTDIMVDQRVIDFYDSIR
jgi:ATP-dependent DNA helicase PIF1